MRLFLRPGLRLVRRDATTLLARGRPLGRLSDEAGRALELLVSAGLAVPLPAVHAATTQRVRARVLVDAPDRLADAAVPLLADSGLTVTTTRSTTTLALVGAEGELSRGRLDGWVRHGVPHLVVVDRGDSWTVGPYVVPGETACLRCLDAHAAETDPRHPWVAELAARTPALVPHACDPALRAAALGCAVSDLLTAAEGGRPASWSATLHLEAGQPPVLTAWLRHPHCGCTWADDESSAG